MKHTLLLAALITLSLTACGSGGSSPTPLTDAQKIAALEASGDLPKLDRTDTIAGIDANANGVRDDIEAIITQKYMQADQRAAAMQYAFAIQAAMLADTNDKAAVKSISLKTSRASRCLFLKFDPTNDPSNSAPFVAANELRSITTNTKKRLLAFLAFDKALDGSVLSGQKGNTCE